MIILLSRTRTNTSSPISMPATASSSSWMLICTLWYSPSSSLAPLGLSFFFRTIALSYSVHRRRIHLSLPCGVSQSECARAFSAAVFVESGPDTATLGFCYINVPRQGGRFGGYIYVVPCFELTWSGENHGTRQRQAQLCAP